MVTRHTEVEQKFDVEEHFVLPDAADLAVAGVASVDPPEALDLEAVYHDTPDLRLARARVTLRRRTGGADAGWHLKLPGADGARSELHAPLGRAVRRPPAALLAPVAGLLRGTRTAPVATLRNHRVVTVLRDTDGRALAEVADDTVTASASGPDDVAQLQVWREVEVELVEGDASLLTALGERLVAAGARPSETSSKLARVLAGRLPAPAPAPEPGPDGTGKGKGKRKAKAKDKGPAAGDVVVAAVRAQVQELQEADIALRVGDARAVHRLRVAARRLRSILVSFGEVLDREVTEPVRGELAWLGDELGPPRDDEVGFGHLVELLAEQPPELVLGPVAARLEQAAARSAADGRERALATLGDPRHLRLLDALDALVGDPPLTAAADGPAAPVLRAAVRSAAQRLRRRVVRARDADGREADGQELETGLRGVRKAAERARYTAEVARAAAPRVGSTSGSKALLTSSRRVHRVLGEVQATVVTRDRARRLGTEAAGAGENAFTFGLLHGLEGARAERARAAFGDLAGELLDELRAVARS